MKSCSKMVLGGGDVVAGVRLRGRWWMDIGLVVVCFVNVFLIVENVELIWLENAVLLIFSTILVFEDWNCLFKESCY